MHPNSPRPPLTGRGGPGKIDRRVSRTAALPRASDPPRRALAGFGAIALACLAAALLAWWIDHPVLLHSDSGSYVRDAYERSPDWPRPLGYGLFLSIVFTLAGGPKLGVVVLLQCLLGAAVGIATFALARRALGAPRWVAAAAALAATLSPLHLLLQRFVLADALALALVAAALAALFWFVERPGPLSALALGAAAAAPLLVRAVWVFLPALLPLLGLAGAWLRHPEGPLRRRLGRAAWAALALAAAAAIYGGYSHAVAGSLGGEATATAGASGFSGWVLWGSVARFAEPGDLDGVPGGEILLSDPESLRRNGSWQIWDFGSTAHRLRIERFGGSFAATDRALLRAALRVAARHPIGFARQLGWSLGRFFRPIQGNADYSRPLDLDPTVGGHLERYAGIALPPPAERASRLGPAVRAWRWSRWLLSGAVVAALAAGLVRPRRWFALLAVGALGTAYLLVVNLAVGFVFVERYYLPIEYLGILSLAAAAGAWRRRLPVAAQPSS